MNFLRLPVPGVVVVLLLTVHCNGTINEEETKRNFHIGAFNVQIFGVTKAGKPDVMDVLQKIVQRYEILLIQEIKSIDVDVVKQLVDLTNSKGPAMYDYVISERLGASSSKEQYAFIHRLDAGISVLDTYQYPDVGEHFSREPFAVRYQSINTVIDDFVLAGIHVAPDEAVEEINSLPQVFTDLSAHFDTENFIVMGDFNCDCSYVSDTKKEALTLRNDDRYTWLIGDDADTTTKSTDCAYDRVVVQGDSFVQGIIQDSALVFRFDTAYNLDYEQTVAVSDHYPVEFQLERAELPYSTASTGITATALASGIAGSYLGVSRTVMIGAFVLINCH